ncbi:MAG TPA: zf-HC2 domain-containing protein [Ktedonobacteraceae bacterium]|jgi:hypothetical protein|nr:zf-HC2 domain-containing protein [Ktedonobacteraceae bacterium]
MNCNKAERYIQLYLDNRLSLEHTRALETHIARCTSCRAQLTLLENTIEQFQERKLIAEPPDLHQRIMQRVSATPQKVAKPTARRFSPWRPSLAEILAAILLATVATLGSILQQPSLRALLPIANGHDPLSHLFNNLLHMLTSLDSNTIILAIWIIGTILGVCITLALVGTDIRSRWLKNMMDRLPVR